ncbi:hypothetical protein AB0J82_20925 [Asanoa sp. NPDC049518]|uniref:hypothetical protein n=1 Tax=unclassified Asanoa TaxID=2685164 RepID=UPI003432F685
MPQFDVHAQYLMDSMGSLESLVKRFAAMGEPVAAIGEAFDQAVADFVDGLNRFEPHRLVEVARMAYLPWGHAGHTLATPAATAAHVELLALIALTAANGRPSGEEPPVVEVQEMSHFVTKASDGLDRLLQLSHLRAIAATDPTDRLAMITLLLRASQVMVRHTSYAEMVQETVTELLDGDAAVKTALNAGLGFDAIDALAVLNSTHDVQEAKLNARGRAFADAMNTMRSQMEGEPTEEIRTRFKTIISSRFEPDVIGSTAGLDEVVARTGVAEDRVRAVIERFRLNLTACTPTEVVDAFMAGKNPMRTHPLLVTADERLMLPHNVLTVDAVKENLEEYLKGTSAWNAYQKHRGEVLEARTRAALERVLPGAVHRDGFQYYIPANERELATGDAAKYTKRVEGDHLVVLDDVALIVEDKAVALSALARGGKTQRIRTDLTGIITKAAEQAGRLRDAIERDGGMRTEEEGWVDLSSVREIHTVAVSLDDLTSIATATAELVRAGLLDLNNIPWTVSLHDLELITELVDRPAEFLLYLRRRLNPDATVMFSAADELDLFLYFFEAGLWVEPDPDQVRTVFDWMKPPSTAERRRFRQQMPVFLTSRTDALDAWYRAKRTPAMHPAPKPSMFESPLVDLVDDLQARGMFGWLSIGATLLEPATGIQHRMARYADQLLDTPAPSGEGRSLTLPMTGSVRRADGWLMVWGTRPAGRDPAVDEKLWRDYLRLKKHQLGLPRGVALVYDEPTRNLVDAYYDGHIGDLSADQSSKLAALRPPSAFHRALHPNSKRSPIGRPKPKRRR